MQCYRIGNVSSKFANNLHQKFLKKVRSKGSVVEIISKTRENNSVIDIKKNKKKYNENVIDIIST